MRFIFGEWQESNSKINVDEVCSRAELLRKKINNLSIENVFKVFSVVSKKWRDKNYIKRIEAQEKLPRLTGFSPEMIRLGLEELPNIFDPEILEKKLKVELKGIPVGNGYKFNFKNKTAIQWQPIGTVLHILSGNVFLVGPGSLVEGLITNNITILKLSSSETFFMPLFIESIIEAENELNADVKISDFIATVDYSSNEKDIIEEFKNRMDGIVVWGGESAVKTYRNNLPARTRIIVFGPKLSLGLVTSQGYEIIGCKEIAKNLASELAIWDQNACTAPQMCFVQGKENAKNLAKELANALIEMNVALPPGKKDDNTAADIRKLRTIYEIAHIKEKAQLFESKNNLDWTVIYDEDVTIESSPLNRTIKIVPIEQIEEFYQLMSPFKSYIQTVGLACSKNQFFEMSQTLGANGVLRILQIGKMSAGEIDDPHDGAYDLPHFLNLTLARYEDDSFLEPNSLMTKKSIFDICNSNFKKILRYTKKSKYYSQATDFSNIHSLDDLNEFSILTRCDLEKNMPPKNLNFAARKLQGGNVTRSGGSTGEPKFSWFDLEDWNAGMENAVEIFYACGLRPSDTVANLMMSGDMYGSFITFNDVNGRLGLTSLPFAGVVTAESFVDIWQRFKFNALQGVPTGFMPILRMAKKLAPELTIQKIMYAGQPITSIDKKWLSENLKTEIISSVIGTTEAGQLAYQCTYSTGSIHHLIDTYNYIEIVDQQGHNVDEGVIGKILVTSLQKTGLPLIRYEIGDSGEFLSSDAKPCPCGNPGRRIKYHGRCDDIMSIGLLNINLKDFINCLEDFPISVIQMIGDSIDSKDNLLIKIETEQPNDELKLKIKQKLFENISELEEHVSNDYLNIDIELFEIGSIPRNEITGKLKSVIDNRKL